MGMNALKNGLLRHPNCLMRTDYGVKSETACKNDRRLTLDKAR